MIYKTIDSVKRRIAQYSSGHYFRRSKLMAALKSSHSKIREELTHDL